MDNLLIIHFLSDILSSGAFFQKNFYNYFNRRLADIHSFNGTTYFSDAKILTHPLLLGFFFISKHQL